MSVVTNFLACEWSYRHQNDISCTLGFVQGIPYRGVVAISVNL